MKLRLGWIPDVPDHRDFMYSSPFRRVSTVPSRMDLTPLMPLVYDQGELGSCTANAIGAAHQYAQCKQHKPMTFVPSRLFIYRGEREMEGTINQDSGAQIRDGMKYIAKQGVCPETMWPYDITKFKVKPTKECFKIALDNQALTYYSVKQDLDQMRGCLADAYPIVFGFSIYESFQTQTVAKTGVAQMPSKRESLLGGHAVLAVGYNDDTQRFIVRNSWGVRWGMKGYFTLPYRYLLDPNLSADFWTVRIVE
jgi:C1A family cysteine protease